MFDSYRRTRMGRRVFPRRFLSAGILWNRFLRKGLAKGRERVSLWHHLHTRGEAQVAKAKRNKRGARKRDAGKPQVRPQVVVPFDPRLRYSLGDASKLLGISVPYLYEKHATGVIAFVKDGRRTFVRGTEIARLSRA